MPLHTQTTDTRRKFKQDKLAAEVLYNSMGRHQDMKEDG